MGERGDRRLLLAAARADLLEGVNPDMRGVPDHVAASWRRAVSSGVHPGEVRTRYHSDLDVDSRLVRCAQPVIEELVEQIADIPMCIALTDARARLVLRRDGNSGIGRLLDRVYFAQGFDFAEGGVGTNGVGTVLEFGESVHIVGAEHFVDPFQAFACAGAPVRDPFTGRIEGVLDISCLSDQSTPLMHSLVRSAASRIEQNLLKDRNLLQQALFDAYTRIDARSRDGVLAVGQQIVMSNEVMRTMLAPADQCVLQEHVRFTMQRHPTIDGRIDLPSGTPVRLRGSTITVGNNVAGMIGVVSVLNEVHGSGVAARARPLRATSAPLQEGSARVTRLAPSNYPAWRNAAATVDGALRGGNSVVVLGEPGTGRLTLLSELHRDTCPDGATIVIEPERIEQAPQRIAELFVPRTEVLHVLRDIDRLSAEAAEALVAGLAGLPDDGLRLAATATEAGIGKTVRQPLMALFRASARIPPLRNRLLDLPQLVQALLADLAPHREVRLSPEALRVLGRHEWPGNVRELAEALSYALRHRPVGCIQSGDLPAFCQSTPRSELRAVDRAERDAIVGALREAEGNRVAAAAALGLARSTLYRKIRQYGITV